MTDHLLQRCKLPFNAVIKDANLSVNKIDEVVLVGGATHADGAGDGAPVDQRQGT